MPRSLDQWKRVIRRENSRIVKSVRELAASLEAMNRASKQAMRDAVIADVIARFGQLQEDTPKDTGRACAGWLVTSDGGRTEWHPVPPDAESYSPTPEDVKGEPDAVWVVNNVKYILRLNAGWSRQKPKGFIQKFLSGVTADIQKRAKEFTNAS